MREQTLETIAFVCEGMVRLASAVRKDTAEVVATQDHIEVIKHYNHLRIATEQIKEARKALEEIEQNLSREQVPTVMRAAGVRTITVEGVGRVSLSNRWSCSMLDKEQSMDWLRDNGHGSLIQETVNSSTLAAFAKDMNETQNKELPSDLFKTSVMTYTSITKAG